MPSFIAKKIDYNTNLPLHCMHADTYQATNH